ncbi:unnamed protein product [Adineta steineri]|uniref:Uncharacterized protein n=2 Tax=Adineta steineri TaxID=433720 RepID=A0A816B4D7_9BILA|nr:unnamed protein product [Adineta steineri]CAF1605777.1 unnamed protein product [Adineta steineri]
MSARTTAPPAKQDFTYLKTGRINLTILRDYIIQEIKRCTNQFHTEKSHLPKQFTKDKCVIVDDDIKNLLGHVQALNDLGASDIRIFKERQHDTSDYRITLFIVRPKAVYMEVIANMIKDEMNKLNKLKSKENSKQYGIIFVPRRSRVCEEKLKEQGVRGDIIIDELNLDFLPIDTDLLSMESNDCFRDLYLNNDTTPLFSLAHGLITLQKLYGIIPNVFVKGDKAKQCYDNMLRMQREVPDNEKKVPTQIENLILIDRTVDLITPMMIPATYEALLDEVFGIQFNRIEVPTATFSADFREAQKIDIATKEKIAIRLLTTDQLYSDTRYLHMIPVGKILQEGARAQRQLRTDFDANFSGSASTIQGEKLAALRKFVVRMSNQNSKIQTLSTHLELAFCIKHELTSNYDMYLANQLSILFSPIVQDALRQIDERIAWKDNIFCILRYLSIITHALGPQLKRKDYDLIKKDIIQTFGLQYLVLIHALEQIGIIYLSDPNKPSSTIRTNETNLDRLKREFNLLQEDQAVNVVEPQDIHYIYYQYAPISVRLIEKIVFPTTNNIQDAMNILPGTTFIDTQQVPMELKRHRHGSTTSLSSLNKTTKQPIQPQRQTQQQSTESKVTLVVFIGGITYGEIAALRFLADKNHDFIIATTHFINGTNLMKSLLDVPILPL